MIETSETDKHVVLKYLAFLSGFLSLDIFCSEWMDSKNLFLSRVKPTVEPLH